MRQFVRQQKPIVSLLFFTSETRARLLYLMGVCEKIRFLGIYFRLTPFKIGGVALKKFVNFWIIGPILRLGKVRKTQMGGCVKLKKWLFAKQIP